MVLDMLISLLISERRVVHPISEPARAKAPKSALGNGPGAMFVGVDKPLALDLGAISGGWVGLLASGWVLWAWLLALIW